MEIRALVSDARSLRNAASAAASFDSPRWAVALVGGVYLLFLLLRLSAFGWNPTVFIGAGDRFAETSLLPAGFFVMVSSDGYDGQFYYRLALDPFTSTHTENGLSFDVPTYRQQRIVYPSLAWLLSQGNPALAPWALILVNWFGLCCLAWLAGAFFRDQGQHALKGALVVLLPVFQLSLSRDLTEISACALLMAALLFLGRDKELFATLFMVLAVIARETTLLVPLGGLAAWLVCPRLGLRRARVPWTFVTLPLLAFILLQAQLAQHWGLPAPIHTGGGNLGLPLYWFIKQAPTLFGASGASRALNLAGLGFLVLCATLFLGTLQRLRRSQPNPSGESTPVFFADALLFGALLSGALVLCLGQDFWTGIWGFMRGACEFTFLGALLTLSLGGRRELFLWSTGTLLVQAVFLGRNLLAP
jgi:hypothetical protein